MWFLSEKGGNALPSLGGKEGDPKHAEKFSAIYRERRRRSPTERRFADVVRTVWGTQHMTSALKKEGQTYPRQTVQMGEEFRESKKSVDVMFGSLLRYLAADDDDVCYL